MGSSGAARQRGCGGLGPWLALALLAPLAACDVATRGPPWGHVPGGLDAAAGGGWGVNGASSSADRSLLGTGYGGHKRHCYDHRPPNFLCNCALVDHYTMTSIKHAFAPGHISCTPTCLRSAPHICYLKNCDLGEEHEVICVQDGCGIRIDHDLMAVVLSGQCFLNETLQLWDCGDVALDLPSHKFISTGECMSVCKGQDLACTFPTRYYAPLSEFHPIPGHAFNGSKPAEDTSTSPAAVSPEPVDGTRPTTAPAPASLPKARKTARPKATPAPAPSSGITPTGDGSSSAPPQRPDSSSPPSPGVPGSSQGPSGGAPMPPQTMGEPGDGSPAVAPAPTGTPQVGKQRKSKDRSLALPPAAATDAQAPSVATAGTGNMMAGNMTAGAPDTEDVDVADVPSVDPTALKENETSMAGAPDDALAPSGVETADAPAMAKANGTVTAAAPVPGNATVDAQAPSPANVTDEAVAPGPADVKVEALVPSPAIATIDAPAPAPVNETIDVSAPGPATEPVEGPAPALLNDTMDAPVPAPVNDTLTPAPAPANETLGPAPAPVMDALAPVPANETVGPAPAPVIDAPAPVPANKTVGPAPAPVIDAPVPAPEVDDTVGAPAPAPVLVVPEEMATAPAATSSSGPSLVAQSAAGDAVYLGPWRECSSVCRNGGPSVRERGQYCISASGTPAPQEVCDTLDTSSDTSAECDVAPCSSLPAYYQLGQWSACDALCGGGVRTRPAVCVNGTGDVIDASNCEALDPKLVEKECNTMPCESFYYSVRAWGECSEPCGGGNRTREVICVVANIVPFTGGDSSDTCEDKGLERPREEEPCNTFACPASGNRRKLLQDPMQDSCSGKTCSGRGTCVQGNCICEGEFSGANCELDGSGFLACPEGSVADASGQCCEGRLDVEGTCCEEGQELDGAGLCCSDGVDACGICGGDGQFIDLSGVCCSTFLDGNGLCCSSGDLDGCGVCSGDGSSCRSRIEMTVQVSDAAISDSDLLDCLSQRITEAVPVDSEEFEPNITSRTGQGTNFLVVLETPGLPLSAASLTRELASDATAVRTQLQQDDTCEILGVSNASKIALCGNNICEFGEMAGAPGFPADGPLACPGDCPFTFTACPAPVFGPDNSLRYCSANGRCLFTSNGICDCFTGYIGDSCATCDTGFEEVDGKCLVAAAGLGAAPAVVQRGVVGDGDSPDSDTALALPLGVGLAVGAVLLVAVVAMLVRNHRKRREGDELTTMTSADDKGKKMLDSEPGSQKPGHTHGGSQTKSLSDYWRSFISTISVGSPRRTPRSGTGDYVEAPGAEPSLTPGQYLNSGDVSIGEDRYVDATSPGGSPPMASSLADSTPEIRSFPLDFTGEEGVISPGSGASSQRVHIIPVSTGVESSGTPLEVARSLGYGAMAGDVEVTSFPVRVSDSPPGSDYRSAASTPTGEFRDAYPVRVSDISSRSATPEMPGSFPVQLSDGSSRASTPAGERQLEGYPIRGSDISSRSATPPDMAGYPTWLRDAADRPGLPTGGRRVEAYPVRLSDVSGRSSVSVDHPLSGEEASRSTPPHGDAQVEGFPVRLSDISSRSATPGERALPGSFPVELSEDGSRSSTPVSGQGLQAYPVRPSDVSSRSATTGERPSLGAQPGEQGPGGRRVEAVSHPVRLSDVSSRSSTPEMTEGLRRAFPVRLRLSSSGTSTPEMPGSFPVALSEGGDSRASTPVGGPQLESRPVRLSDISAVSGVSTDRGASPPGGQVVQAHPVHLSDPDSRASTPEVPGAFPVALSEGGASRASTPGSSPQLESRPVRLSGTSTVSGTSTERGLPGSFPVVLSDGGSRATTPATSPPPLEGRPVRWSDISPVSGESGAASRGSPGAFPVEQSDEGSRASTPAEGPRVQAYPVRLSDVSRASTPEMPGSFPVALSEGGDSRASTPVGGGQLESRPVRLSDVSAVSAGRAGTPVAQPPSRIAPAVEGEEGSGGSTPFGSPRIEDRPVRLSDVSAVSGADRAAPGSFPIVLSEGTDSRASTPVGGPVLESQPVRLSDASNTSWMSAERVAPDSFPVTMSDDGSSRASTPVGGPQLESRPVRLSDVSAASGLSAYRGLPGVFPAATTPPVTRPVAATEGVRVQAIQSSAHHSDGSSRASTPEVPRTSPAALEGGSSRASTPASNPQLESRPVRLSDSSNVSGPGAEPVAPDSFPIALSEGGSSRASTPSGGPVLESRPVRLSDVSAVSGASTERGLPGSFPTAVSEGGSRTSTPASQRVPQSFPLAWSEGDSRASTPVGGAAEGFQVRVSDIHSAQGSPPAGAVGVEGFPVQFSDTDSRASTPVERGSSERGRTPPVTGPGGDFPLPAGYYAADSRARSAAPPRTAASPGHFPEHNEGATPPTSPRTAAGGFPVAAGYLSGSAAQQPRGLALTSGDSWRGGSTPRTTGTTPASPPVRGSSLPHLGTEVASGALGSEFERGSSTGSGVWAARASSPALEVGYYATPTGNAPARVPTTGAQDAVSGFPIQLSDTSSRASTPSSLPQPGAMPRSVDGAGGQPSTPVSSSPSRIPNFPIQPSEGSSRASTPMSGAPRRDSGASQSPSPSPPAGVQAFAINISDDASSVSSFGGAAGQGGQAPPQLSGFPIDMSDTTSQASSSAPSTPRRS
ncbi:unnamed protein product [Ostreobium quekettii]|uniref:EGF-like domain-containing protein n=1 Tax=Ostreobium quekettii TaxID=121088 RepID=A0A8S1J7R5_9CHLO|nr:unnamed protein product [Ostreobium quekettii]